MSASADCGRPASMPQAGIGYPRMRRVAPGVLTRYSLKAEALNNAHHRQEAILTMNADTQELFKLFHRPGNEKRIVVILREDQYDE